MHRYATAPRSTFVELFEQARAGVIELAEADYPPVCDNATGEVSLALGRSGAMIVHVHPGECRADDFRLKLLFETGTCVFSSPDDLHGFWSGPLAAAFGIPGAQAAPPAVIPEVLPREEDADPTSTAGGGDDAAGAQATEPSPPRPRTVTVESAPAGAAAGRLTPAGLAAELARAIHGQDAALERVARAVVAQRTKRHPARPGSVLLLGPSGVGKTATAEALPDALRALGDEAASVFRVDCGELTDSIHLTRLLGSPPGYSGHEGTTRLLTALEAPGCILLVDELEKAHPDVFDLLLGLLDAGRVTGPAGQAVDARHVVVALTTNVAGDELADALGSTPLEDRWATRKACVEHLRAAGLPAEFVGRIGTFAVYRAPDDDARRGIAEASIGALAREYGLLVERVDPVVIDVVHDIASDCGGSSGARDLRHAAQELLAERFAELAADGPPLGVEIVAGPPLAVRPVGSDCDEAATA